VEGASTLRALRALVQLVGSITFARFFYITCQ
jgi:hypothetical protein